MFGGIKCDKFLRVNSVIGDVFEMVDKTYMKHVIMYFGSRISFSKRSKPTYRYTFHFLYLVEPTCRRSNFLVQIYKIDWVNTFGYGYVVCDYFGAIEHIFTCIP